MATGHLIPLLGLHNGVASGAHSDLVGAASGSFIPTQFSVDQYRFGFFIGVRKVNVIDV